MIGFQNAAFCVKSLKGGVIFRLHTHVYVLLLQNTALNHNFYFFCSILFYCLFFPLKGKCSLFYFHSDKNH